MLIHTLSIFAKKEVWQAHFLKLWQYFPHRPIFSWFFKEISWCWMVHFYLPYYFRQSYYLCAILLGVLSKNTKKLQKFLHIWKWIGKQVTISDTFRQSPLPVVIHLFGSLCSGGFLRRKSSSGPSFYEKKGYVTPTEPPLLGVWKKWRQRPPLGSTYGYKSSRENQSGNDWRSTPAHIQPRETEEDVSIYRWVVILSQNFR